MSDVRQINDQSLPKARRREQEEKSATRPAGHVPLAQENPLKRKWPGGGGAEQDLKLKEFLDVMQRPSKTKVWGNAELQEEHVTPQEVDEPADVIVPNPESDDEYQVMAKKAKPTRAQIDSPTKDLPLPPAPDIAHTKDRDRMHESDEPMTDEKEVAARSGTQSDADWLRSHTKRTLDVEDAEEAASDHLENAVAQPGLPDAHNEDVKEDIAQTQKIMPEPGGVALSEEDKIRQTGRLYIRNLPFTTTEDELRDHFSRHGALDEVCRLSC
jgi:multiple RNA-binding domain-containing protein 1